LKGNVTATPPGGPFLIRKGRKKKKKKKGQKKKPVWLPRCLNTYALEKRCLNERTEKGGTCPVPSTVGKRD